MIRMDGATMWMSLRRIGIAACLFAATGSSLAAQVDCGAADGGAISGAVVNDRTGDGVEGSWVVILSSGCRTMSDARGRFGFAGVEPGSLGLDAGKAGYRNFRHHAVTVSAGRASDVVLRLIPGGPLGDCRALPACAPVLASPPTNDDPEQAFQLLAHGVAIAIAWSSMGDDARWHVCVDGVSSWVKQELAGRYGPVAAKDECELKADENGWSRLLHHRPSGRRAFHIAVRNVVELPLDRRRASVSYMAGSLWGEGWDCEFRRVSSSWEPVVCQRMWES